MSIEERVAVLETTLTHVKATTDITSSDVKLLLAERHESIGKKSIWAIIYGAIGAIIVAIIGK